MSRRDGVFRRNGWWWVDYCDADGRRHREKAAPSYEVAKLVYRDKMNAIAKGEVIGVREEGMRLRDFVTRKYWPTVKPTLSRWEQQRTQSILDTQILTTFGDVKLAGIRREAIERWQAERLAGVAGGTANKELMRLKHILNRAVAWGYLRDSPARAITKAKEAPGRVRYLTAEEVELLLNGRTEMVTASDGRTWTVQRAPDPALRLYIVAALQTGARRGELLNLRWADLDMKAQTLTFRQTKNGDTRTIPMTATMRALLQALPRPLDPDAPVFPQRSPQALSRAFGYLVQRLGIKDLHFHDLRHDAASTLTMAGVSQRAVMAMLGHRDPRMSIRYQHLSPEHLLDAARALDTRPHERSSSSGTISAPAG
ncbi:MAG TPA: tyrosine-type recombinase/integrase [Methylomirabilota bacterium]|nr:tyrosine-type recombinase/integrase [Methylomirabilota bacterium]